MNTLYAKPDSKKMTHTEVSKLDIREVVKDDEWQILRRSFLGSWKSCPETNVQALREYLDVDRQDPLRWRRIHNYLTGSAFRLGVISHPAITAFLREIRAERWARGSNSAPQNEENT